MKKGGILGILLQWLIPLAISAVAIGLVLRNIEFQQLVTYFSQIGLGTYLLASLLFFVSIFFRAFCWYILMRRKVPFKDTLFTMGAGYLLNNIFPFRLGEVGRAVLLGDPAGPSTLEVLSSILVERVFDVLLAAMFVLMTISRILNAAYDQTLIVFALTLTISGLAVLFLAARFRTPIINWLSNWGERSDFVKRWIIPKAVQVLEGLSVLNDPGLFLLAFGSLAISWLVAFGENFIVFRSLYPSPPFWWMIFVLSTGAFGAALPSAPSGLGVFEGVMVAAFALLGVNAGIAFAHAIVIHALFFIYANILGLIGMRLRGDALIGLYRRLINRAPQTSDIG